MKVVLNPEIAPIRWEVAMGWKEVALLAVGVSACAPDLEDTRVERTQEALITFTAVSVLPSVDGGSLDGPVVSAQVPDVETRPWSVNASSWLETLFLATHPRWSTDPAFVPEGVVLGRPGVAKQGVGLCDSIIAQRPDGNLGLATQAVGERGCVLNSGFSPLPAQSVSGGPAVSISGTGTSVRYDVFAPKDFGATRHIFQITGTGTATNPTWGTWSLDTSISLLAGTSPSVIAFQNGLLELFACRNDNILMRRQFSTSWGPWMAVRTGCFSTPSVAGTFTSKAGANLKVATLNSSNQFQFTSLQSNVWSNWVVLGGSFASPPSLQRTVSGFKVWGKGTDGLLYFGSF